MTHARIRLSERDIAVGEYTSSVQNVEVTSDRPKTHACEDERFMKSRVRWRAGLGVVVAVLSVLAGAHVAAQYAGWKIPEGAAGEKSPLASSAGAAERGKALYASNCARCHGPAGKGDGPDSDEAADLTDDLRTDVNPEGVLFYNCLLYTSDAADD